MSESKHTPGPWKVVEPVALDYRAPLVLGADGGSLVCQAEGGGPKRAIDGTEARANACLIAAAPELLDMLKKVRECIAYCRRAHSDPQSGDGVPIEVFIDAAIAKAEGQS